MTGIRARIVRLLPKGRFLRRFTMLSGGQVLAQLLVLASSPILTRVYTPAEFGVYGVFTALTGILGNVLRLWGRFNGGLYGLGGGNGLGGPLVGCRGNYVLGVSQGL